MTTASGWRDALALVAAGSMNIKNPSFEAKHPRGKDGRFIEKGGSVKWVTSAGLWLRGVVKDFNDDLTVTVTRSDNNTDEKLSPKRLYKADAQKAKIQTSGMKKVGGQAGSNVGGFFEDGKGDKFYVKTPQTAAHVSNEVFMNRLYQAAGAAAPEVAVSPNGKQFLTKIEDSVDWHSLSGPELERFQEAVANDFAIDAWLYNWDAPANDNVRWRSDGVPLRVDAGGAGQFRARGSARQLQAAVSELTSLRDPRTSRDGVKMYAKVTKAHEEEGVKRILAISPERIREMAKEDGVPSTVADNLITRRAWLAQHYSYQLPETTVEGKAQLAALNSKDSDTVGVPAPGLVLKKIGPDAMPLAKGSPVWLSKKTGYAFVGQPTKRVPDTFTVKSIRVVSDDDPYSSVAYIGVGDPKNFRVDLQDAKGNVIPDVLMSDMELLRENYASAASKYSTGEPIQMGDRVSHPKAGAGTVKDIFPLFTRVAFDDGSMKVFKVSLLQKTGDADPEATATIAAKSPNAIAGVGKLAVIDDPIRDFPQTVYSLPHRAEVLVISTDGTKSAVLLGDSRRVNVNNKQLYDVSEVDRSVVDAMPVKAPRVVGPRTAKALDLTKLPPKPIALPSSNTTTLETGERLLKMDSYQGQTWWKIKADGSVEYVGAGRRTRYKDPRPVEPDNDNRGYIPIGTANDATTMAFVARLNNGDSVTDITPKNYWAAAEDFGAKKLKPVDMTMKKTFRFDVTNMSKPLSWSPGHYDKDNVDVEIDVTQLDKYIKIDAKRKDTDRYGRDTEGYYLKWMDGSYSKLDPDGTMTSVDMNSFSTEDAATIIKRLGNGPNYSDTQELSDGTELSYNAHSLKDRRAMRTNVSNFEDVKTKIAKNTPAHSTAPTPPAPIVSRGTYDIDKFDVRPSQSGLGEVVDFNGMQAGLIDNTTQGKFLVISSVFPKSTVRKVDSRDEALQHLAQELVNGGNPFPLSPTSPAAVQAATGKIPDISEFDGFKSLKHKVTSSGAKIMAGEFDELFAKSIHKDYKRPGGYGTGRNAAAISDGSTHGDPYMAEFVHHLDGDQQSLKLPTAAFNGLVNITGNRVLHRGVDSAQQKQDTLNGAWFVGTGVFGNGSYWSTNKTTTNSYGSHKLKSTLKPGAKTVLYDDASTQLMVDVNTTQAEKMSLISEHYGHPTQAHLDSVWQLVNTDNDKAIDQIVEIDKEIRNKLGLTFDNPGARARAQAVFDKYTKYSEPGSGMTGTPRSGESDKKAIVQAALVQNWATLTGQKADVTINFGSYWNKSGASVLLTMPGLGDQSSTKNFSITYDPIGHYQLFNGLDRGRSSSVKNSVDVKKSEILTFVPRGEDSSFPSWASGSYGGGSGGQNSHMSAAMLKMWQFRKPDEDIVDKISQLDARAAFLSDPSRWALANGYDALVVPQGGNEDYYIPTHRAGLIFNA